MADTIDLSQCAGVILHLAGVTPAVVTFELEVAGMPHMWQPDQRLTRAPSRMAPLTPENYTISQSVL
jgi:hypothetical protein